MAAQHTHKLYLKTSVNILNYFAKSEFCFNGHMPFYAVKRQFHKSSPLSKKDDTKEPQKCIEKCSKKQREVLTSLHDVQNRYLQPRTPQITGRKFIMSPPVVDPKIDIYIEEACRIKEECRHLREGKGKKGK